MGVRLMRRRMRMHNADGTSRHKVDSEQRQCLTAHSEESCATAAHARTCAVAAADQVVQQRDDELLPAALRCVLHPLKAADCIVGEDGALALAVDARHHVEGVVGEEAAVVQRVAQHLQGGGDGRPCTVGVDPER